MQESQSFRLIGKKDIKITVDRAHGQAVIYWEDVQDFFPDVEYIHIVLPKDFVMLSSFHPKRPSHLPGLSFELVAGSFGAKEFAPLAEALKTNSTLTTLKLDSNSIEDDGAKALAEACKINSALATLTV